MVKILEKYIAKQVTEGNGVIVNRVFGKPETTDVDPFLMLDYFETHNDTKSNGFPWHPHKGIETITYMLRGGIEHEDNLGNKDIIGPGELQWMTAGKGIMHQEMPVPSSKGFQGFQFWVNLPAKDKLVEPSYKYIKNGDMQEHKGSKYSVKVISGEYKNIVGPIDKSKEGIKMFHVSMEQKSNFELVRESSKQGYIFVFKGEGLLDNQPIKEQTTYILSEGSGTITSNGELEFIFAEGKPLKEPIAWYGPIVMNTRAEISETLEDLQNGTFIERKNNGN